MWQNYIQILGLVKLSHRYNEMTDESHLSWVGFLKHMHYLVL